MRRATGRRVWCMCGCSQGPPPGVRRTLGREHEGERGPGQRGRRGADSAMAVVPRPVAAVWPAPARPRGGRQGGWASESSPAGHGCGGDPQTQMCTRAPSARFGESRAQTKGCCPGPGGAPHPAGHGRPAGHDGARAQKEAPGSRQQRALWSPPLSSDAGGRRAPGGPRVALRSRPGRAGGASAPAPPPRSQHPCGIRARWLWQD